MQSWERENCGLSPEDHAITLTRPAWIAKASLTSGSYLFPSRQRKTLLSRIAAWGDDTFNLSHRFL
ncbi:MAG: hypothetical protein EA346_11855 [Thioalkalivibrio sp.]|nr:MAG: hypothetical protein EA346_11855 [Thioalkalivibrio sp.]